MIKPPKLVSGDTVATVSLSWGGPGTFPHRYAAGKAQLEARFGLRVVESRHALRGADWLARNPQARADDLMESFADPTIRAIFSTIGGDDSIRLLPYLDLDVIRANPKVFMGYSDTTVSHFACFQAGLVSFYGPSIMAGFAENGGLFPYMVESVDKALFSTAPIGPLTPNREGWTVERLEWSEPELQTRPRALQPSSGWRFLQGSECVSGPLIGGCLDVIEWLPGTPLWPDPTAWEGAILFLETSEEAPPPRQVTRTLRRFAAMGVLDKLSAILWGRPGGAISPATFADYDRALLQVVSEEQGLAHLPIVAGMDFGHTDPMMVLPYGVRAQVDPTRREVTILESAVS